MSNITFPKAKVGDEIQNAALNALRTLDGTMKSAVNLLTGATDEEIAALGGLGDAEGGE